MFGYDHIVETKRTGKLVAVRTSCPECGFNITMTMEFDILDNWSKGEPAETSLWRLSKEKRQILLTGLCGDCVAAGAKPQPKRPKLWADFHKVEVSKQDVAEAYEMALTQVDKLSKPRATKFHWGGVGLTNVKWHGFAMTPWEHIRPFSGSELATMLKTTSSELISQMVASYHGRDRDIIEDANKKEIESHKEALKIMDGYSLLTDKLTKAGLFDKVTLQARVATVGWSYTPADVIMWSYTLAYILAAEECEKLTCRHLMDWFPIGVPTNAYRLHQWDKLSEMDPDGQGYAWLDNVNNWPGVKKGI